MLRLVPLLAIVAACHRGPDVTMTDSVDLTWDFELTLRRFEDNLHSPYVKGATLSVYVYSDDEDERFVGWTIESADPSVFRIDSAASTGESLVAAGVAVGDGETALVVRDGRGRVVGRGSAEVRTPDRVELEAHGYLIMGRTDEAAVGEARVLAGGTATYLARYFRDGRELHGNGVLSVGATPGIVAEPRTSFLFEDREWLTLRSTTPGTQAVPLFADGEPVGTVSVVTVEESELRDVAILTEEERGREDGAWLVALAQAYDGTGRRIFGIDYQWDVDGRAQMAFGDLYRYKYARGAYQMVTARKAGHSDSVMIQAEEGFVDSSNHIGCAAGSGGSGALAAGLLVLVRRRRRVTRAAS